MDSPVHSVIRYAITAPLVNVTLFSIYHFLVPVARMNGVCGVMSRPEALAIPEALKMHYLVVVHDAESQARDVEVVHLPLKVASISMKSGLAGVPDWRSSAPSGPCQGYREEQQHGHLSPRLPGMKRRRGTDCRLRHD